MKLHMSVMNSEIIIEGYDLISQNRSRRRRFVACFIKDSVGYSYKTKTCLKKERIFTETDLLKSKSFILGTVYRPQDKIEFFNYIDQIFSHFI